MLWLHALIACVRAARGSVALVGHRLLRGRMDWPQEIIADAETHSQCSRAEWILSKAEKNLWVECWRIRAAHMENDAACTALGWKPGSTRKPLTRARIQGERPNLSALKNINASGSRACQAKKTRQTRLITNTGLTHIQ